MLMKPTMGAHHKGGGRPCGKEGSLYYYIGLPPYRGPPPLLGPVCMVPCPCVLFVTTAVCVLQREALCWFLLGGIYCY